MAYTLNDKEVAVMIHGTSEKNFGEIANIM
jgi:hypothetical protein